MRVFLLARHAQSQLNVERRVNGDPALEVPLTEQGLGESERLGLQVAEVPTIWLDRSAGVSNFKLRAWLPKYLRWYFFAYGPRLTADDLRARTASREDTPTA